MKKPTNIINTPPTDNESWGSYNKETKQWSNKVYSGKAIREWLQNKIANKADLSSTKNNIKIDKAHSNLDYYYGPYNSLAEAYEAVPLEIRGIGLTVGIKKDGKIIEYQWKTDDLSNSGLKEKFSEYLTITLVSDSVLNVSSNQNVIIRLTGDTTPSSIELYSKTNPQDNYVLTNYKYPGQIIKNSNLNIDLNLDSDPSPRTVYYSLRVIDIFGNVAKTQEGNESVEFVVNYKEVQVNVSGTSSIFGIKVKSLNNLLDKNFSFNISKILNVQLQNISIVFTEDNQEDILYKTISDLNQDLYTVILDNLLDGYKGKTIKVKINYTLNGIQKVYYSEPVTTILGSGIFSNIYLQGPTGVYQNTKFDLTLYFEAEEEQNYNVILADVQNLNEQIDQNSHILLNSVFMSYKYNIVTLSLENPGEKILYLYLNNDRTKYYGTGLPITIYPYTSEIFIPSSGQTTYNYINDISNVTEDLFSNGCMSYILDLDCFIPYQEDRTAVIFKFFNISIYRDYIQFETINYPTPIQEQISLGFAFNVHEGNYYYNALFINGVLCYKVPLNSIIATSFGQEIINNLTITDFHFYYNTANSLPIAVSNSTTLDYNAYHIPTQNYLARHSNISADLPVFKLTAIPYSDTTDEESEYYQIYEKRKITPGKFGDIGVEKYNDSDANLNNIKNNISSYNVLMSQTTKLKKLLQKKIGVICSWEYNDGNGNIYEGIVEVHTQGTSTLDYALPNFKFTFLVKDGNEYKKLKNSIVGSLESVLTAKADYMDSSHLNNTPTAMFYNRVVQSDVFHGTENGVSYDYRSPSAQNGGYDAIEGIPVILEIQDIDSSNYVNYGSFMLNIDKTGNALKFDLPDTECISFEGTSNEQNSGLSSRFTISPSVSIPFDVINTLIQGEGESWYSNAVDSNSNPIITYTKLNSNNVEVYDQDSETNQRYQYVITVLDYLAEGLEYRYPDGDFISKNDEENLIENETVIGVTGSYQLMSFNHFKRLFKMFYWIAKSDTYSSSKYKSEFGEIMSFEYCALYFIQLMIFGQTDNLGKNCMFDQWTENGLWYPRPYDLDSQVGLNNAGNDIIPPFVEIKPEFSLNYEQITSLGQTIFETKESLTSDDKYYQVFQNNPSITQTEFLENYIYPEYYLTNSSQLNYINGVSDRYGYSSPTSKLWINFYKHFKDEIILFYGKLRQSKVNQNLVIDQNPENNVIDIYSPDSIINYAKSIVIDKLGVQQYNIDFRYKYIKNTNSSEQQFAFGNRYIKYRDWIKKRFSFCDTYFKYERYNTNVKNGNIQLEFSFPQYFMYQYQQENSTPVIEFYDGINPINFRIDGAAVNEEMYFAPENITSGDIYSMLNKSVPKLSLNNLLTLAVNDYNFFLVSSIANNTYMYNLSLNNITSSISERIVPINIKTLSISNSTVIPDLSSLNELRTLTISNCNNLNLNIINCSQLATLNIINCSRLNLTLQGLENISTFNISGSSFSNLDINGCNIDKLDLKGLTITNLSFSGSSSNIGVVDLRRTRISNPVNITNLNTNTFLLNFSTIPGVICDEIKTYTNYLSIQGSSLSYWKRSTEPDFTLPDSSTTNKIFDGSLISNLNNVYSVNNDVALNSLSTGRFKFRFWACNNLVVIKNVNLVPTDNNYSTNLFDGCVNLRILKDSNIYAQGNNMFNNCEYLVQINNTPISISNSNASYMFRCCHKLNYSYIKTILNNNFDITNFQYFMKGKSFDENTTIDLNDYVNATNLTYTFATTNEGTGDRTTTKNTNNYTVTIVGTLPTDITTMQNCFIPDSKCTYIFTDWIKQDQNNKIVSFINKCTYLRNCYRAFNQVDFSSTNSLLDPSFSILQSEFFINPDNNLSSGITDIRSMFANTKNLTINPSFQFPSTITTAYNALRNSSLVDNSTKISVHNFFSNCTRLSTVASCFQGSSWVKVDQQPIFNSNQAVNIFKLFGNCNTNIVYGFVGNWTCEYIANQVQGTGGGQEAYANSGTVGPYYGNTVSISNDVNLTCPNACKLFEGATLVLESGDTLSLEINNPRDIRRLFYETTISGNTSETPKYIEVQFGQNALTTDATEAFYNCNLFKNTSDTIILPHSLIEAGSMFAGSNIYSCPDLHNTSIRTANNMFSNCTNIKELYNPMEWETLKNYASIREDYIELTNSTVKNYYSDDNDLLPTITNFVLPNTIISMEGMFNECQNLRGGIPINFINTNNNVTSLKDVFNSTAIMAITNSSYLVNDAYPYQLDLSLMFDKVTNVTNLFKYNWLHINNNLTWQKISSSCFSKCTIITGLFMNNLGESIIKSLINIELNLSKITNANYAFYQFSIPTGFSISNNENSVMLSFADGMFATGGSNNSNLTGTQKGQIVTIVYNNISSQVKTGASLRGFIQGHDNSELNPPETRYSPFTSDIYYRVPSSSGVSYRTGGHNFVI